MTSCNSAVYHSWGLTANLHVCKEQTAPCIKSTNSGLSERHLPGDFHPQSSDRAVPVPSTSWAWAGARQTHPAPLLDVNQDRNAGNEKAPLPTSPRNAHDQYCSPLVQQPNRWLWLHSKKKGALKWLGSTAEPREQQHLEEKLKPPCPKWLKH